MTLLVLKYQKEYIVAMGDTIDCVSLINQLAKKHPRLLVPVQGHYLKNIETFFPSGSGIELYPLRSFNDYTELALVHDTLVVKAEELFNGDYIQALYYVAGLSFHDRSLYDTIATQVSQVKQIEPPQEPYVFIPEGGSERKYKIDRKYVTKGLKEIVPPQDGLMLSYAKIIEHAAEIHCHATGYFNLIDRLPTTGKLFMHHYARKSTVQPKDWVFIKNNWTEIFEN